MKITKRKLNKIAGILGRTRINKDFFKFMANSARRYLGKRDVKKQLPYPTTIMLELTNKCNLRCTMCPREHQYGKEMNIGNMDPGLAKKVIDECYPYLQSIGLTGLGETLFAPELVEIASYVKSKKKSIVIFISSNANIPGFMERVADVLPVIDTLQISIDGVGETYDSIRLGGTFDNLESNLTALMPEARKHGVDVMFNMVISRDNYQSMPDVIDFAVRHGVKFVNFNYINLASIPEQSMEYYDFFSSPEFESVREATIRKAAEHPAVEVTGLERLGGDTSKVCPLVYNSFQINHDGEVPPCCAKPFSRLLSFGNAKDSSIISIINSPAAKSFQAAWQNGGVPSFCRHCSSALGRLQK